MGIKLFVGSTNQKYRDNKRQNIENRHGVKNTVQAEENRKQKRKSYAEYNLTNHGQCSRFRSLSHGLKKNEAGFVDTSKNNHAKVGAE